VRGDKVVDRRVGGLEEVGKRHLTGPIFDLKAGNARENAVASDERLT
jgi:hypothetical protein